jgi:hypothetical protein
MTRTIDEYIKANNIFIDNFEMNTKALCVEIDNEYHIAIDERQFKTTSELNTAKLHEIGHCQSGALYNVNSSPLVRSKCEYQADKWAITHFIKKNRLIYYLKQNCPLWEIADNLGVTEPFLIKAINYYFR